MALSTSDWKRCTEGSLSYSSGDDQRIALAQRIGNSPSHPWTTFEHPDLCKQTTEQHPQHMGGSFITPYGGGGPGYASEEGSLSFFDTNVWGDGGAGLPHHLTASFDPTTGAWVGNSSGETTQFATAGWTAYEGEDGVLRKAIRKKITEPSASSQKKSFRSKRIPCC